MQKEIVISISGSLYDRLMDMDIDNDTSSFNESVLVASIQNGTLLPKGHGKLKDVDALYEQFSKAFKDILDNAPTIIEKLRLLAEEGSD